MSDTKKDKNYRTHDILWAPWRLEYITNSHKNDECIFCTLPKSPEDRKNLIVFRKTHVFVIMNRYPYNNGHLMVVPYKHTSEMSELSNEEKLELFNTLQYSQQVLKKVMTPQGFNMGANFGNIAGAGIDQHIHFHLVPRWSGDTNYMPIITGTKVISESLEDTWDKLYKEFHKKRRKK
ncbi:MAG: HIT domain-containing protein [bacterium]